jgi:hypothetical protein
MEDDHPAAAPPRGKEPPMPPFSPSLAGWPSIGKPLHDRWQQAPTDLIQPVAG